MQIPIGVQENCFTALALIGIMDEIYSVLNGQHFVLGIYLDLQRVFDTVNQEIILYEGYNYGVRGVALDWFESHLLNRQQNTIVANAIPDLDVELFAVDTGEFLTNKDPFLLTSTTNEAINKLNELFSVKRLSLNVDITC